MRTQQNKDDELRSILLPMARQRLQELDREQGMLLTHFPELERPTAPSAASGQRKTRRMSAAARKAISIRMKAMHAARRAARLGKRGPGRPRREG